ncbi:hypothetical protein BT93_H1057 [Corymbia citriodora subsp. variegata]|nr:hypothetical protein BT93_H1057 [Corymbia citriodora subsp. variegata]
MRGQFHVRRKKKSRLSLMIKKSIEIFSVSLAHEEHFLHVHGEDVVTGSVATVSPVSSADSTLSLPEGRRRAGYL